MFSISAAVASSFCVLQFAIFPAPTSVTGGAAAGTVIAELPLFPSLVAVIFAEPVATPVTRPLAFTVATPAASVDQMIARPESGLPLASSGVAVSCCVAPTRIVALVGLKLTDATGTMTVIAALPLLPSLAAVMLAVPAASAVTSPLPFTVATPGASLDQVIVRPESGLPLASSSVAVSCCVAPAYIDAVAGLTLTEATGTGFTVMAAPALFPSLVAVMFAEPTATPGTSPFAFTVATLGASLDQVIVRPESGLPLASSGVAVSCWVPPTTIVAAVGLTVSDATGIVTVTAAVALLPSLVAVTFAEPAATAVTSPLASTVATPAASVDHVMTRPVRTLPSASWSVAVICCVAPTPTVAAVGLTLTEATGAGFTVMAALPPFPSLVAVIFAAPAATAVTRPAFETVAAAGLSLDHVTIRPLNRLPLASYRLP